MSTINGAVTPVTRIGDRRKIAAVLISYEPRGAIRVAVEGGDGTCTVNPEKPAAGLGVGQPVWVEMVLKYQTESRNGTYQQRAGLREVVASVEPQGNPQPASLLPTPPENPTRKA